MVEADLWIRLRGWLRRPEGKVTASITFGIMLFLAVYLSVYFWVRLSPVPGIGPDARRWVISTLRAAAEGKEMPAVPERPALAQLKRKFPGPMFVELYLRGRVIFRHVSNPKHDLLTAVKAAAEKIGNDPQVRNLAAEDLNASRFKVDLLTAKGPVVTWFRLLLALSVVPGVDGLGLRAPERTVYMTPDELLRRNMVTGFRPFKFVQEFKAGLHIDTASEILARRAGLNVPPKGKLPRGRLFRFRTYGFVEAHHDAKTGRGDPLPVFRGNTPAPKFNKKAVIDACVRGGRYLLRMLVRSPQTVDVRLVRRPGMRRRHQTELELLPGTRVTTARGRLLQGQFRYIYFPLTDNYVVGGYSLPRHAGTTYGLALLTGVLKKDPRVSRKDIDAFREGAAQAIKFMADQVRSRRCRGKDFVCVSLGAVTDLGSTALPVVAVMEYTRQTGDRRYLPLGRKMANFLTFMQRPDGEFCHLYNWKTKKKDCKIRLLYYSGEAAFALAMAYKVLKDPKYLEAAKRGLDYQTGPYVANAIMKFLYGEDHWTAMAAEEIWPYVKKKAYADFAYGFARFQQRQQFVKGETPFDDYVGGYGITPFFPPHLTPAGSRTEAAVSAYLLSLHRKEPRPSIKNQILRAFRYIVTHQVRIENAYMFVRPAYSVGAIRKSPVKYDVRIDYVQHTIAAMLRALHLVPE